MPYKKKTVVIISGGMDSTTLAYYLQDKEHDLYALSFNYGQKHNKELEAAKTIVKILNIPHKVIDVSELGNLLKSALTSSEVEVPHGYYADENMKATIVPNRNMIMLSIAAGYAKSLDADYIAFGPHVGDHPIYPDCRSEFVRNMNDTLALAMEGMDGKTPKVIAPFVGIDKTDIVRLGTNLKVPYELTWSCYEGGEKHCGKCGTCCERHEAFVLAGVKDPTEYQNKPAESKMF